MRIRYGSVCSGVEAASLAWRPLGWEAAFFSEIEPFPCAVLRERFPDVPNLGDMTKIEVDERGDIHGADGVCVRGGIDVLVGGTPCQSFSVAGKREGLGGASGLAFHFIRLLSALRPKIFVWENVPGALSSATGGQRDFNFLVREYAECGFDVAWRVLDAQYTRVPGFPRAIPQRRRRVFVVGSRVSVGVPVERSLAARILFERESLFGDPPTRRGEGQEASGGAGGRAEGADGEVG